MFCFFRFAPFSLSATYPFQCLGRLEAFVFPTGSKIRARYFLLFPAPPDRSKIVIFDLPDQPFNIHSKEAGSHASFFVTPTILPSRIPSVSASIPAFFLWNSILLFRLKLQAEASSV
jgi:hypothetical protein